MSCLVDCTDKAFLLFTSLLK